MPMKKSVLNPTPVILQIRLHAVYKQSTFSAIKRAAVSQILTGSTDIWVKIGVTTLFVISFAAICAICLLQVLGEHPEVVPGTPFCKITNKDFFWMLWSELLMSVHAITH